MTEVRPSHGAVEAGDAAGRCESVAIHRRNGAPGVGRKIPKREKTSLKQPKPVVPNRFTIVAVDSDEQRRPQRDAGAMSLSKKPPE
jgi:hypothetical protein